MKLHELVLQYNTIEMDDYQIREWLKKTREQTKQKVKDSFEEELYDEVAFVPMLPGKSLNGND